MQHKTVFRIGFFLTLCILLLTFRHTVRAAEIDMKAEKECTFTITSGDPSVTLHSKLKTDRMVDHYNLIVELLDATDEYVSVGCDVRGQLGCTLGNGGKPHTAPRTVWKDLPPGFADVDQYIDFTLFDDFTLDHKERSSFAKVALRWEPIYREAKSNNPMTLKSKKIKIKYSKLKKKAQTIKCKKLLKVSKAKGLVTFKFKKVDKKKFKKYFEVNTKTGELTVKKGLKKGTYKVKISVTAAGTEDYKSVTKTATCTVTVK